MNKLRLRVTRLIFTCGLATSLTLGAYAAPLYAQTTEPLIEEGRVLNDIGTGESRVLTSEWAEIAPGEQHTYSFAHDGSNQPLRVWIDATPIGGVAFEIWSDDQLALAAQDETIGPLGTGSAVTDGSGTIRWEAISAAPETFFVIVRATGNEAAQYTLNISSPGLSAAQPGTVGGIIEDVPPADDTVTVAIATVTTGANIRSGPSIDFPILTTAAAGTQLTVVGQDISNTWLIIQLADGTVGWIARSLTDFTNVAPIVDTPAAPPLIVPEIVPEAGITPVPGQSQDLPNSEGETQAELDEGFRVLRQGETHWYTFELDGDADPVQIWMDVEPNEGANFRIYNEENAQTVMAAGDPEAAEDVGRGTSNPNEAGDLFWRGEFEEHGTFYVLVEHSWEGDVSYSLHMAGPGLAGQP